MTQTLFSSFLKYTEYTRISFQKMLAYRVSYLIGVVTYVIHVAVYYYLYQALYSGNQDHINGYALGEILTYVSIGWMCKSLYLNYIDREITDDIQSGQIAMDLIKPIDFQMMYFSRGLGQSFFRAIFFTPPIILVTITLFPIALPQSFYHFFLFCISLVFSVLIYLGINYIVGIIAVFFLSIRGIIYSKNLIIELLSGLLIPLDWFPQWFQTCSNFLPFQAIAYYPMKIYLGRVEGASAYVTLLLQAFWLIFIFISGRIIWRLCQKKIQIQGG